MEFNLAFNTSYLVAFAMGLISSLHCIGMCGSIIGTLTLSLDPKIRQNKVNLFSFALNYNIGRIISYAMAGALVGLLSFPFEEGLGHRVLQLLSAVVMASAGLYIAGLFPRFAYIEKIGSKFWKKIEPFGRKLMPVKSRVQAFLFGMVWGWLPCGLVYAALLLAATSGSSVRSGLTMFAFGLGTLPAVIGVGIMTGILTRLSRMKHFRLLVGLFMVTLALFSAMPSLYPMRLHHLLQL